MSRDNKSYEQPVEITEELPDPKVDLVATVGNNAVLRRYIWWNFWIIACDASSWQIGLACMDANAVLPVFISTLTDSKLAIGFLFALLRAGADGYMLKETNPADLLHAVRVTAAGGVALGPGITDRVLVHHG